jgi:hypothetical protein
MHARKHAIDMFSAIIIRRSYIWHFQIYSDGTQKWQHLHAVPHAAQLTNRQRLRQLAVQPTNRQKLRQLAAQLTNQQLVALHVAQVTSKFRFAHAFRRELMPPPEHENLKI